MRKNGSYRQRGFTGLVTVLVLAVSCSAAQVGTSQSASQLVQLASPSSTPLSSEAQAALQKGLAAAQEEAWPLAIRSFEEARKSAPLEPTILFNLGLAESKIGKHEIRALHWFKAYLVIAPDAENAALVKAEINKLQIKAEATAGELINQAKHLADKYESPNLDDKIDVLGDLAEAQAMIGDFDGSDRTLEDARRLADTTNGVSYRRSAIVAAVKSSVVRSDIVQFLAREGDLGRADEYVKRIADLEWKVRAMVAIAMRQAQEGKRDAASSTLLRAKDVVSTAKPPSIVNEKDRDSGYLDVATGQANLGDKAAATKTIMSIRDKSYKDMAEKEVARASLPPACWITNEPTKQSVAYLYDHFGDWTDCRFQVADDVFTDFTAFVTSAQQASDAYGVIAKLLEGAKEIACALQAIRIIDSVAQKLGKPSPSSAAAGPARATDIQLYLVLSHLLPSAEAANDN